jgi:hypothetical protein
VTRWTKEKATTELHALIAEIGPLEGETRQSAAHTRWLVRALRFLEEVYGESSRYYLSLAALRWCETGGFVVSGWRIQEAIEARHQSSYQSQLEMARGLLLAADDELAMSSIGDVYKGRDTPQESSGIVKVLSLIERKLRKMLRVLPSKERDVQDAVENLLIGADIAFS